MAGERIRVGFAVPRVDLLGNPQALKAIALKLETMEASAVWQYVKRSQAPVVIGRFTIETNETPENKEYTAWAAVAPLAEMVATIRAWAVAGHARARGKEAKAVYTDLIAEIDRLVPQ